MTLQPGYVCGSAPDPPAHHRICSCGTLCRDLLKSGDVVKYSGGEIRMWEKNAQLFKKKNGGEGEEGGFEHQILATAAYLIMSCGLKALPSSRCPRAPALAGVSSTHALLCLVLSRSLWGSAGYSCFLYYLVLLAFSLLGLPLMIQTKPPNPFQKAPAPVPIGTSNPKSSELDWALPSLSPHPGPSPLNSFLCRGPCDLLQAARTACLK